MKLILAVAFALVAVALSDDPTRPQIAEHFGATGWTYFERHGKNYTGTAEWGVDQTTSRAIELHQFPDLADPLYLMNLQRWDVGEAFNIDGHNRDPSHDECKKHELKGGMPNIWGWVQLATYQGKFSPIPGMEIDLWEYETGGMKLAVGVSDFDHNTPVFFGRHSVSDSLRIIVRTFETVYVNASWFEVPEVCKSANLTSEWA